MSCRGTIGVLGAVAVVAFVAACDPGGVLRIENHTTEPVQVVESGIPTRIIAPDDVLDLGTVFFKGERTIEIVSVCDPPCEPELLASIMLTWDDYEDDPVIIVGDP